MYLPKHFEVTDIAAMQQLMQTYPLATLVTHNAGQVNANHIPLMSVPECLPLGCLQGHVALGNPLLQDIVENAEVLVIFQGAQNYISPSWYLSKQEHHQVVPTWNYSAVHAYGQLRVIEEIAWLQTHLAAITAQHEAMFPTPWKLSDAPEAYLKKMFKAIVGIEIQITQLQGKWKVSQNRSPIDQQGVIAGLQASGNMEMAQFVEHYALPKTT